jgi:hypothetical protein
VGGWFISICVIYLFMRASRHEETPTDKKGQQ